MGGTAGRTTLAGEGLQHQDGHSHLLASAVPNLRPYDPAFAYEIAVIVQDGIRRMYQEQEAIFYYITLTTRTTRCRRCRRASREGILRACTASARRRSEAKPRVQLFGSGADPARGAAGAGDPGREVSASPPTSGA